MATLSPPRSPQHHVHAGRVELRFTALCLALMAAGALPIRPAGAEGADLGAGPGDGSRDSAQFPEHAGTRASAAARGTSSPPSLNEPSAGAGACTHFGAEVTCSSGYGTWHEDLQCWVRQMTPRPPADDPRWGGRADGAIYRCQTPTVPGSLFAVGHDFWAPGPGQSGAPVLIDAATAAVAAVERMRQLGTFVPMATGDTVVGLLVGKQAWMAAAEHGAMSSDRVGGSGRLVARSCSP